MMRTHKVQEKTTGKDAATIKAALDSIEQEDALVAELRSKTWKRSEVLRIRERLDSDGLQVLLREIKLAEAEGRVEDDLAPSLANLDARNPGAWIIPRVEVPWIFAFGRWLAANPEDGTSYWEERRIDRAFSWIDPPTTTSTFATRLGQLGRIATAGPGVLGGLVFASAAPAWIPTAHVTVPRNQETAEDADLIAAQRERFDAMETAYKIIVEKYRLWPQPMTIGQVDPQKVTELEGDPGARWFGFDNREHMRHHLNPYRFETRSAQRKLGAQWTATKREGYQRFLRVVQEEQEAGRIVVRRA